MWRSRVRLFHLIDKDTKDFASIFVLEDSARFPTLAINRCLNLLSKSEIQRHNKIKNLKRRRQFIISRFLLSEAIYRQLGVRVTIDSYLSGQPFIVEQPIFCSISYSNYSIAVGYSTYGAIGLDIERYKQRNMNKLVSYCFHADEISYFNTLVESKQIKWFYRKWTLKEAAAKANGDGISLSTLGTKINENDTNKVTVIHMNHNYSLACVHHSDQKIQLAYVKIQNSSPWIDFFLKDFSN